MDCDLVFGQGYRKEEGLNREVMVWPREMEYEREKSGLAKGIDGDHALIFGSATNFDADALKQIHPSFN